MFMENGMNRTGWQACFLYNTLNWNFAVFKHQLVNFVNIFCSGLWNWASWTRLIIQVFPPPFEFRNPWCNSWIWRRRLSIDIWQAFVDIGCVFAFQEEKSYDCSILDSVHFEEIADFSKLKVRSHCVRVRIRFSIRFSFRVRRTVYTESEFLSVFDLISCPQLPRQTSKCDFV